MTDEGPFDGILGFSQGGQLATTLLIRHAYLLSSGVVPSPDPVANLKCIILLCGTRPYDFKALGSGAVRLLDPAVDGEPLKIPSAHVWGENDRDWPAHGTMLASLFPVDVRACFAHSSGHQVPVGDNSDSRSMVLTVKSMLSQVIEGYT